MRNYFDKLLDRRKSVRYRSLPSANTRLCLTDHEQCADYPQHHINLAPKLFGPLIIYSLGPQAKRAILVAHGTYTPRGNMLRPGSGMIEVPNGLTVGFRAQFDRAVTAPGDAFYTWRDAPPETFGTRTLDRLDCEMADDPAHPAFDKFLIRDRVGSGQKLINYRLGNVPRLLKMSPTVSCDIVHVRPGQIAHMHDVFNAYVNSGSTWDFLYSAACREIRAR